MNNVIETLANINDLLTRVKEVHIYINDRASMVMARNLVIIYLLLSLKEDAIDLIVNLWYSAALTE